MPREIETHKVNGCNDGITLTALDEPGCGGASHRYAITGPEARVPGVGNVPAFQVKIRFQDGPIKEAGVNGITHEVLLAVLIDRLTGFQAGPFACQENATTLYHLIEAQETLKSRTRRRLARGVEGTHAV